jgi:predicted glutamine amidotransferase
MCIAVIKPKGAAFPSKETLKRCFEGNSDGAGIAWQDGDIVRWSKGHMTFEAFYAHLETLGLNADNLVFMHFRIGTHGGKTNPNMTHPFPILKDKDAMVRLEGTCKHIAMHNGIISKYGITAVDDPRSSFSDTVNFTAEWVADQATSDLFFLEEEFKKACEKESSSAKYAIMGCGQYTKMGIGWIEDAGCFYSNSGFRQWSNSYYSRGNYCGTGYQSYGTSPKKYSGEFWTRSLRVLGMDEAFTSTAEGKKHPVVYLGADFNEVLLVNEFDEVFQNQPSKNKKIRWIKVGTVLQDWEFDLAIQEGAEHGI